MLLYTFLVMIRIENPTYTVFFYNSDLIWGFGDVGPPFVSRTQGICVLYPSISCSDNVVDM